MLSSILLLSTPKNSSLVKAKVDYCHVNALEDILMVADNVNYRDDIGGEPTNDQNCYSKPGRIKALS